MHRQRVFVKRRKAGSSPSEETKAGEVASLSEADFVSPLNLMRKPCQIITIRSEGINASEYISSSAGKAIFYPQGPQSNTAVLGRTWII